MICLQLQVILCKNWKFNNGPKWFSMIQQFWIVLDDKMANAWNAWITSDCLCQRRFPWSDDPLRDPFCLVGNVHDRHTDQGGNGLAVLEEGVARAVHLGESHGNRPGRLGDAEFVFFFGENRWLKRLLNTGRIRKKVENRGEGGNTSS